MKEFEFDDYVSYEFDNEDVYNNFHTMRIWVIISLIVQILLIICDVIIRKVTKSLSANEYLQCYINAIFLLIPISLLHITSSSSRNNRSRSSLTSITVNPNIIYFPTAITLCRFLYFLFVELAILIIFLLTSLLATNYIFLFFFLNTLGRLFIPHIFIYIAAIILMHNCNIMNNEWKANLPKLARENKTRKAKEIKQQQEVEQQERKQQLKEEQIITYNHLIFKSGMRFFIKYYRQLERLPIRDVNVTENYSSAEKEERLTAAKQIIDENLSILAFESIISNYSDILEESELSMAKTILQELKQ